MAFHRVTFPGKLALQQRVLAAYRVPFFDALAQACDQGLSVFAGLPRPEESIAVTDQLHFANYVSLQNEHFLKGPYYFCFQRGLLGCLEALSPDALIVEANPRYLTTPAAVRWMKQRGRPVLGWGLGAPALSGPFSGPRKFRRSAFLHLFDALLTYSRRGADEYAAMGFPADKIFVAPNAAAGRPSRPMTVRPVIYDGKPNVLFVGRLQARKRVDLLLQACASLPATLQPRLVIIGDGPERRRAGSAGESDLPFCRIPRHQTWGGSCSLFFQCRLVRFTWNRWPGSAGSHVTWPASHHGAG